MSIEIFKDKESEKREQEELLRRQEKEEDRKRAQIDRKIAYLNMAVQICIATQEPSIESIFAMADKIQSKTEE